MAILLLVAMVRACYFVIEQPSSSVMDAFPYITYLQKVSEKLFQWRKVSLYLVLKIGHTGHTS